MTICLISPEGRKRSQGRKPPYHDRKAAVYRIFDKDGAVIYVGCSTNPPRRLADHFRAHPNAASAAVEWFPDYFIARDVERETIAAFRPPLNKIHHPEFRQTWRKKAPPGLIPLRRDWRLASAEARAQFLAEISPIMDAAE